MAEPTSDQRPTSMHRRFDFDISPEPAPERPTPLSAADELDRLRRNEGRVLALARRWREQYPAHSRALFDAFDIPEAERERR